MERRNLYRPGNIEDVYIIDEEGFLGEGGSAIVRKGIRKDTGEAYAIKILDK
jgi:hypothetical protein